uniref:Uncharacterized protein n=1 Tax=Arundo donax TaxID=35708 RepID=A0A0A9C3R2_ARUDO
MLVTSAGSCTHMHMHALTRLTNNHCCCLFFIHVVRMGWLAGRLVADSYQR